MIKPALLPILLLSWPTPAPSPTPQKPTPKQKPAPKRVADFELRGAATVLDDRCIQLTPDAPYVGGSVWAKKSLDLNNPFEISVKLGFGERDRLGADGIVFVLSPEAGMGWRGEGIGFSGLRGALGIELDTYQNWRQGDPVADHLALLVDGHTYHGEAKANVVELPNLEDGRLHALSVTWTPKADTLTVSLDGKTLARYPGQIVRHVFAGQSVVRWGLTAGTGRKTNRHVVCFDSDGIPRDAS